MIPGLTIEQVQLLLKYPRQPQAACDCRRQLPICVSILIFKIPEINAGSRRLSYGYMETRLYM